MLQCLSNNKYRQPSASLASFMLLLALMPDSPHAPRAAYTAGLIHMSQKEPELARATFQELIRRYPDSDQARRAKRSIGASDCDWPWQSASCLRFPMPRWAGKQATMIPRRLRGQPCKRPEGAGLRPPDGVPSGRVLLQLHGRADVHDARTTQIASRMVTA